MREGCSECLFLRLLDPAMENILAQSHWESEVNQRNQFSPSSQSRSKDSFWGDLVKRGANEFAAANAYCAGTP